jgi:hypothetical protein
VLDGAPRRSLSLAATGKAAPSRWGGAVAEHDQPAPDEIRRLAPDLAGAVAQAGVNPTLTGRELQNALRSVIPSRHGSCDWTVDHAGWVVRLLSPEEQTFSGKTLEEALSMSTAISGLAVEFPWGTGHAVPLPSVVLDGPSDFQ